MRPPQADAIRIAQPFAERENEDGKRGLNLDSEVEVKNLGVDR
jgi:hypothetical protein